MFCDDLMKITLIFIAILRTSQGDLNQCNFINDPIKVAFNYSNLSQVRIVYKPFVLYSSITVVNIQAEAINDFIFANYCAVKIDLSNNEIEFMSGKSFSRIVYLEKLNLARNSIESMDNLIDSLDVGTIRDLDLSYNRIQKLRKKFTKFFTNLNTLTLRFNDIDFIESNLFEYLINLKELYLENNKLKVIHNNTFLNLVNLNRLIMNSNSINKIETNAFRGLINLKKLILDYNFLEDISDYVQYLTNLTFLGLNSNRIKELLIDDIAGLELLEEIELGNNQITELVAFPRLINLQNLRLECNSFGNLKENAFNGMKSLFEVNLDQSKIESIEVNAFIDQTNLNMLMLSYNRLTILKNGIFEGLFNLTILRLDYNIISTIESRVFRPLISLEAVHIDHNMLVNIPSDLFLNLNSLDTIYLSYNQIGTIISNFLQNLPTLSQLFLNENNIEHIEKDAFVNLSSLYIFDLSSNKLREIKDIYFKGLYSLRKLYLDRNGIDTIERDSFSDFQYVSIISLNDNFLYSIDSSILIGAEIYSIVLNNNKLEEITSMNMSMISRISVISLAQNNFKYLRKASLNYLIDTLIIDFSFNKIESISNLVFDNQTSSVQILILNNNLISNLAFLEGTQFINLAELDLSFNLIDRLFASTFSSFIKLQKLSIGSNRIKFIDDLIFINNNHLISIKLDNISYNPNNLVLNRIESIDLSMNNISEIGFLNNLTNLTQLYLRSTNLNFRSLNLSLFSKLNDLDLSENVVDNVLFSFDELKWLLNINLNQMRIKSLDQFRFHSFKSLKMLNLSYNEITKIEKEHFSNLLYLGTLDLSNNNISFIEENVFQDMHGLEKLNLEKNNLKKFLFYCYNLKELNLKANIILQEIIFFQGESISSRLQKIYLSDNSLDSLSFLSNIKMDNIDTYIITRNRLKVIYKDSLANMISLVELSINSNRISFIESSSFAQLDKLEYLRLDDNNLTYLDNPTFANLFHLKYLNLSYNQLEVISGVLFSDLYSLQTLDLSFNRLKSIESFALNSLWLLQNVYIDENTEYLILSRNAFDGLESIVNIFVSFNTLNRLENQESLLGSLQAKSERIVNDVIYYKSINILYDFNITDPYINCTLVIQFLKNNIQVNLRDDFHLSIFLSFCQKLDLFY